MDEAVQPSTQVAAPDDTESPTCRICFAGAAAGNDGQLISPCACTGSQKYVHLGCLRRWQRSVQLTGSNHPEDVRREERHEVCNVCRSTFNLPPQDRASMMSDLACFQPSEIKPGLLLVTRRSAADSVAPGPDLNLVLRAYIETKAAHFREAVYLLTEIRQVGGSDGSDAVMGVNLSRALEIPSLAALNGSLSDEEAQDFLQKGVVVLWLNGGPVKPCTVTSMICTRHLSGTRRAELSIEQGLQIVVEDDQSGVLAGPLRALLSVAVEEAEAAASAGQQREATVVACAGIAQWSRTQLLGEIARGSWGCCTATSADVEAAAAAQQPSESDAGVRGLWSSLRHSERLRWAPENELSRDADRRLRVQSRPEAPETVDPQAEALNAFVREFEAMRRGSDPPRVSQAGHAGGAEPGRAAQHGCPQH